MSYFSTTGDLMLIAPRGIEYSWISDETFDGIEAPASEYKRFQISKEVFCSWRYLAKSIQYKRTKRIQDTGAYDVTTVEENDLYLQARLRNDLTQHDFPDLFSLPDAQGADGQIDIVDSRDFVTADLSSMRAFGDLYYHRDNFYIALRHFFTIDDPDVTLTSTISDSKLTATGVKLFPGLPDRIETQTLTWTIVTQFTY